MKSNTEFSRMLMIPAIRDGGSWDLLLVLGDENIDRVKQYDPCEADLKHLKSCPEKLDATKLQKIIVCYATEKEMKDLISETSNWYEVMHKIKRLFRGFKFCPEKGDGEPTIEVRSSFRPDN